MAVESEDESREGFGRLERLQSGWSDSSQLPSTSPFLPMSSGECPLPAADQIALRRAASDELELTREIASAASINGVVTSSEAFTGCNCRLAAGHLRAWLFPGDVTFGPSTSQKTAGSNKLSSPCQSTQQPRCDPAIGHWRERPICSRLNS